MFTLVKESTLEPTIAVSTAVPLHVTGRNIYYLYNILSQGSYSEYIYFSRHISVKLAALSEYSKKYGTYYYAKDYTSNWLNPLWALNTYSEEDLMVQYLNHNFSYSVMINNQYLYLPYNRPSNVYLDNDMVPTHIIIPTTHARISYLASMSTP